MDDTYDLSDLGRNPSSVTLKDATRDEMLAELERRYKAAIILVIDTKDDDDDLLHAAYAGGYYNALGMAHSFIDSHLEAQRKRNA